MVTDGQIKRYWMLRRKGKSQVVGAAMSAMDVQTGRKYERLGKLPSEVARAHDWRTRSDPFADVWDRVRQELELNPGLQATTLLQWIQREYSGQFQDGQLRTLQRRIKIWRATEGPSKEVFFAQVHKPGQLCQSDFTNMSDLEVTIQGRRFEHMAYHFVLTYSNWESCTVCFSESFESLSEGMQNALWKLGAVPQAHRTDRLTAAVNNLKLASAPQSPTGDGVKEEPQSAFKRRYEALLSHYGLKAERTQARRANENGDIEQRHHRLKQALDQALMLRGSRDFTDRSTYERFVQTVENQLNAGRQSRLAQEMAVMRSLPARRLESYRKLTDLRVNSGSLIRVDHNVYSVNSRLIGEKVNVRLYVEHVEVWHGQRLIEQSPRLRGRSKSRINYRHVIDWLVRKIPRYTTNCMNS